MEIDKKYWYESDSDEELPPLPAHWVIPKNTESSDSKKSCNESGKNVENPPKKQKETDTKKYVIPQRQNP